MREALSELLDRLRQAVLDLAEGGNHCRPAALPPCSLLVARLTPPLGWGLLSEPVEAVSTFIGDDEIVPVDT